jgi:hypothetical protein
MCVVYTQAFARILEQCILGQPGDEAVALAIEQMQQSEDIEDVMACKHLSDAVTPERCATETLEEVRAVLNPGDCSTDLPLSSALRAEFSAPHATSMKQTHAFLMLIEMYRGWFWLSRSFVQGVMDVIKERPKPGLA